MKSQLRKLVACIVAAGLITTGFTTPVPDNAVASSDQVDSKKSVSETIPRSSQVSPLAVRDLHNTNLGAVEVKPSSSDVETTLSKRRGSRGKSRGSSRRVKSKSSSRKKRPAKNPSHKKRPTKKPSHQKSAKGTSKKNKKCPAHAPKSCAANKKDAKGCCKPSKCRAGLPKKCTRKEKDANGCCTVALEFTKYPKGKLHWSPPKAKKRPAERRSIVDSDGLTFINPEAKARALEKRSPPSVEAGKVTEGEASDILDTFRVVNCVAIAGYDTMTHKKVMAHINARTPKGVEYDKQFEKFANIIESWKGPVEVTVRWPHRNVISEEESHLRPDQTRFEDDLKMWVSWLAKSEDPKIKVFHRPAKQIKGEMRMFPQGDVAVD